MQRRAGIEAWPSVLVSCIVGTTCILIGCVLVYRGTTLSASPLVLCSVTGLLIGIALLVVLPQAVESMIDQQWHGQHIFSIFILAPMTMYFIEHVIIDHQHAHGLALEEGTDAVHVHDDSCNHPPNTPYGVAFGPAGERTPLRTPVPAGDTERGGFGQAGGRTPLKPKSLARDLEREVFRPADESAPLKPDPAGKMERRLEQCGLLLRLCAWITHAMLDGLLLGTAEHLSVLIPLAFAILICAMQDVAGMYIYFSARGVSLRFVAVAVCFFGCAFPAGTGISLLLFRSSSDNERVLDVLRCVMAGLFVYMALFELAPPHAHGRIQNLKYFCAFGFGLLSAYLADAFEDHMHEHEQQGPAEWLTTGMTVWRPLNVTTTHS